MPYCCKCLIRAFLLPISLAVPVDNEFISAATCGQLWPMFMAFLYRYGDVGEFFSKT